MATTVWLVLRNHAVMLALDLQPHQSHLYQLGLLRLVTPDELPQEWWIWLLIRQLRRQLHRLPGFIQID